VGPRIGKENSGDTHLLPPHPLVPPLGGRKKVDIIYKNPKDISLFGGRWWFVCGKVAAPLACRTPRENRRKVKKRKRVGPGR